MRPLRSVYQAFILESVWAFRNVRARGWRAVLASGLLAVALAANVIVFSAADSIVFHRVPFRDADRLVSISSKDPKTGAIGSSFMTPALLDEWRKQTAAFSDVQGYLTKTIFLTGGAEAELVRTSDITPGLIELLGAKPRWGRSLVAADARSLDPQVVLMSEQLARTRFGDPARAVNALVETSVTRLLIVGVMPADFRFPDGEENIWRALDPRGPLTMNFSGVSSIARLAPSVSIDTVRRLLEQRSADVAAAAGRRTPYLASPEPLRSAKGNEAWYRAFVVLLGAAFSLLLITAANVISLELATALNRGRVTAVQLALGSSPSSLQRTSLIESLCIALAGYAGAVMLASMGLDVLVRYLPDRWIGNVNPLDLDGRALTFMAIIAGVVWLLSALPTLILVSRRDYMSLLKIQGYAMTAPKAGARFRGALAIAQMALAVMLLVAGVLYTRSYEALLRLDKGFDSAGVAELELTLPNQFYSAPGARRALAADVVNRIKGRPGVVAAMWASAPPSMGNSPTLAALQVDDRQPVDGISIRPLTVGPDYFALLRIPLKTGRLFEGSEPSTDVIVSETFAKRFWPGASAVGRTFRIGDRPPLTIIGVVGHVRTEPDGSTGPSLETFQVYTVTQPPPPPRPGPIRIDNTGGSYGYLDVTFRVDSAARVRDVVQAVRGVDARLPLKVKFVDDVYARFFDDRLVATQLVGIFGALAFAIAVAGIYSVMAFLVTQRTREMAIRVALGADRLAIGRLVLSSSLRLAALGVIIGVAASLAVSRVIQSQLFQISAINPPTFALVALAVLAIAALATWQPVRQAVRIDPIKALRAE